jgi:hypothetical protein
VTAIHPRHKKNHVKLRDNKGEGVPKEMGNGNAADTSKKFWHVCY